MKVHGLSATRRTAVRGKEISWAQAYETNAEIQSGSYCARFECADHIHRLVVHRGVDFFQNSVLGETTRTA